MEYYNFINENDAPFELIKTLSLPTSADEKITIEMQDKTNQDALHILSEGHVKILGLSILLAKAIYEKTPFLIFDDIVNSIDDDHRDGVAKLLITHSDFSNIQMILTCHGEIFVTMLDGYVNNSEMVERYMFIPAEKLEERGIFMKYRDSKVPLAVARQKYDENDLKDSAMSCRRAVEYITGKLWNKLSEHIDGGISVKLRRLQSAPDLNSIATALHVHTSDKYVLGAEEVNKDLENLLCASAWMKLNKGTHVDDKIPEFAGGEIKSLLELVEKFARDVDNMKIKASVIKR